MTETIYRIYFNSNPLQQEIADKIEEIIVDQEIDIAWEARIKIGIFLDDEGYWTEDTRELLVSFSRFRIEIKNQNSIYIPLIDGPVVGFDMMMDSEPGKSYVIIIVQDDSVFLNLNDEIEIYEDMSDDQIVQQVFGRYSHISEAKIEKTTISQSQIPQTVVQRSTAIRFLKFLAKRQGMYVYVLPGPEPGKSIGYFQRIAANAENLTSLVLLGPGRNIDSFNVRNNGQQLSNVEATSLLIANKETISAVSDSSHIDILGDKLGYESMISEPPKKILPPDQGESVNLENLVIAEAERLSYSIEASGNVLSDLYPEILQPYKFVGVYGVNPRISGDYLISKVVHTITPSGYSQSFTVKRNAISESSTSPDSLLGDIF